jgi:hypothetical protein
MSAATPSADAHHALPVGQRLGEFEIRAVIGVGGFGIVYHAFDHALERDVAIKEYMPGALAARSATLHVSVLSQGHAETFALGLKSFVNEARLLARFDHPSLVKVHRFWEAHGTAYMVMPLYRGRTLKALRQARTDSPDEAWLRGLVAPLLGALETLHAEGVYHRDIAPDNVLVGDDGRPVLLDFGAARRVISDRSQTLTAILKPSYAPIEQYAEAEGLRQGPWTDLYALGATLHYAVTGVAPQPATARALGTESHRPAALPRPGVSIGFLQVIDWMMAVRPEHRPQSVAALREVLEGRAAAPVAPVHAPAPAATAWERTAVQPTQGAVDPQDMPTLVQRRVTAAAPAPVAAVRARRAPRWALAAAAMAVAGVAVAAWRLNAPPLQEPPPAVAVVKPTAVVPPEVSAPADAAASAAAMPVGATMPVAVPAAPPTAARAPAAPPPAPPRAVAHRRETPAQDLPAVAAAPAPAPVAAEEVPTPDAAAATPAARLASPREQCDGRHLLALHRCLKRVCQAPELANHRDCRRVRQVEASSLQRAEQ